MKRSNRLVILVGVLLAVLAFVAIVILLNMEPSTTDGGEAAIVESRGDRVIVWHDDHYAVTCWIYKQGYAGGISCLPDSEVAP